MIPRSQHFRDPAPFPFKRSGIMRVFEKARFKALLLTARRRAHYPGKKANASIEEDDRRRLPAGEDIVADRARNDRPRLEQTLVHSLATDPPDGHTRTHRQHPHHFPPPPPHP